MGQNSFIDYYEILQVSPNADLETIERVFRMLAKRYHPDNDNGGNSDKFDVLVKAYRVISNPKKRAAYDVKHEKARALQWKIYDEASSSDGFDFDIRIQEGILSLLYVARRRDAGNPGMGIFDLERMLGCPEKHMEFHIWYLKEKGWILRTDTGAFAITSSGVDAVIEKNLYLRKDRLLPETNDSPAKGEPTGDSEKDENALLEDSQETL